MGFSEKLVNDPRVQAYYKAYMAHPFIRGLADGSLCREKFKNYLVQDTHYLKDYGRVYAHAFLLGDGIRELQFLHTCIGVVLAEETNMHIRYLSDYGLDVYKIESMPEHPVTRAYLDYMLSFAPAKDMKTLFMSALPCTLTYEFIGKELFKERQAIWASQAEPQRHYYDPWIESYAGQSFEDFSKDSCDLIDRYCVNLTQEEEESLIQIFLEACKHEMHFWDMSFETIKESDHGNDL